VNLKEAKAKGKLKEFLKEREKTMPHADKERFEKTLKSMTTRTLKASPAASSKDDDGD